MDLIQPLAEAYAAHYSSEEDALLKSIAQESSGYHAQPHMLSGHLQGKFLEIISKIAQPHRILELGTMIGYSAICLAKGLREGGVLHTIESREDDAVRAMNHFKQAGIDQKIQLHVGNAMDILPTIAESWDLVFIDADKVNYSQYYSLIKPNLKSGGLLIADNVLFHGEVLRPEIKGKNAKAIQAFNEMVRCDADMETVLLTIRDGLLLMRKK